MRKLYTELQDYEQKRCRQLEEEYKHEHQVKPKTFKTYKRKEAQLLKELDTLKEKIKEKCPHLAEDQYISVVDDGDEYNYDWVYWYYCGACSKRLK